MKVIRTHNFLKGFPYVFQNGSRDTGLVLFHGTGGDENDLLDLATAITPDFPLVSPRGRAPENGMNRWFARHAEGILDEDDIRRRAEELTGFLPAACDHHNLSSNGLRALGFSNGANMAAAMLLLYPRVFAGAILLRPMLPLLPPSLPNLKDKPVFIAAGLHDTMIPKKSTEQLIKYLEDSGAQVQVHWANAGHGFGKDEVDLVRHWAGDNFSSFASQ